LAFAYALLLLLPVAAVGYLVWDHRRKKASREAVSAGRMEELLGVAAHAPPVEPSSAPRTAAPETPAVRTAGASAQSNVTAPASYLLRTRLLTPPQTLLYYLLKTGLPDHAIFAQMPVAAVLEAGAGLAAYAREEQARIFARHVIDFVIADKSTRPVAVVKLTAGGDTQNAALVLMRSWFAAAGVRYVELDSTALPRREAVRAVVLGDEETRENGEPDAASAH
jgi:hypothetical protein